MTAISTRSRVLGASSPVTTRKQSAALNNKNHVKHLQYNDADDDNNNNANNDEDSNNSNNKFDDSNEEKKKKIKPSKNGLLRHSADAVSILRLLLAPLSAYLHLVPHPGEVSALIFSSVLLFSDACDGILARRFGSNPWGDSLDAMVDKWLLIWFQLPIIHLNLMPIWLLVAVQWRENTMTLVRFFGRKYKVKFSTSLFGKMKNAVLPTTLCASYLVGAVPGGEIARPVLGCLGAVGIVFYSFYARYKGMMGKGSTASVAGLAIALLSFVPSIPFHYILISMQIYFAFGSLAEYSIACKQLVVLWWKHESIGSKIYTIACTFGVALMVLHFHIQGDIYRLVTLTSVLCANLLIIFTKDLYAAIKGHYN